MSLEQARREVFDRVAFSIDENSTKFIYYKQLELLGEIVLEHIKEGVYMVKKK